MGETIKPAVATVYYVRQPVRGVVRPTEFNNVFAEQRKIIDRYSSIHNHFMLGRPIDAVREIRKLADLFGKESLGNVSKLKESIGVILDTIKHESLDEIIDRSTEAEPLVFDLIHAYAAFGTNDGFVDAGLEILKRSVVLGSDLMTLLLAEVLDFRVPFDEEDKNHLAEVCETIGNVFLEDASLKEPLIEDGLRQIVTITDPFFFRIFHDKIAEPVLAATRQLFSKGDAVNAILNCLDMWRNTRKSDDPAAKRITSRIKEVLLAELGGEDRLKKLSDPAEAERCGVPGDSSDEVSEMAAQLLLRQDLDVISDGMMAIGRPVVKSQDSTINSLLNIALQGGPNERKEALRKLKELISARLRPRQVINTPSGSYYTETRFENALSKMRTVRDLTRAFYGEKYLSVKNELEGLELELVGDIVISLRKDDRDMQALVEHVFISPSKGDTYLIERLFRVPQLRERNKKIRGQIIQLILNRAAECLRTDDIGRLKSFIKAEPEKILFNMCLTMLESIGNKLVGSGKKDDIRLAVRTYELLGAGEADDSEFYLLSKIMIGKINLFFGDRARAMECFSQVIAVESPDPETVRYRARAYYFRGGYLLSRNDFERARDDLEKAVDLMPDNALHLNELALAYANLGQNDKAKDMFKRAVTMEDAPFMPVHLNASSFFWEIRAYEASFNIVKNYIDNNKLNNLKLDDPAIYCCLVDMYRELVKSGNIANLQGKIYDLLSASSRKHKDAFRSAVVRIIKADGEGSIPKKIMQLAN